MNGTRHIIIESMLANAGCYDEKLFGRALGNVLTDVRNWLRHGHEDLARAITLYI